MTVVAIIPARGGSKRLPGKNIKILGGKPLIAWTIEAAINSHCFDRVIVTTDDIEIAEIARKYGAEVPFIRPPELAGDNATSDAVIEHAVEWLEENNGMSITIIALLQPTSPFRNAEHIKSCFSLMSTSCADGVVSVSPCNTPLELCNTLDSGNSLSGFIDTAIKRTQDMKKAYQINGAIYLFKKELSGSLYRIYSPDIKSKAYIMDPKNSVDIDTELDFLWAEFLLSQYLIDK